MADDIQGQPGEESRSTAAETTPPATSPETAAPATGAAEPQPATTNPTSESAAAPVDWGKVDVRAYQEMKQQYLEQTDSQGQPVNPPAETAAPVSAPPAAEEAAPAAPPAEEPEVSFGQGYRPRLGKLPPVMQEAIQLVRQKAEEGEQLTLAEAEKRVQAKYGLPETAAPAPAAAAPGKSASEIKAQIESMEAEMEAAGKSADTEKIATLQRDLRKADRELQHAEQAEHQVAQSERNAFATAKKAVVNDYPQFKDAKSPLSVKYLELFDRYEAAGSDIMLLPAGRQLALIAKEAAIELGIKPAGGEPPAAPTAATPSPTVPQAPTSTLPINPPVTRPPVMPASGANRTATPANQGAQLQQRIDSVKTMDEYEKLKTELLATT